MFECVETFLQINWRREFGKYVRRVLGMLASRSRVGAVAEPSCTIRQQELLDGLRYCSISLRGSAVGRKKWIFYVWVLKIPQRLWETRIWRNTRRYRRRRWTKVNSIATTIHHLDSESIFHRCNGSSKERQESNEEEQFSRGTRHGCSTRFDLSVIRNLLLHITNETLENEILQFTY